MMDDTDIIRNISNTEFREKAFYIADIGDVIEKHKEWTTKLPRVIPHFGISFLHYASLFYLAKRTLALAVKKSIGITKLSLFSRSQRLNAIRIRR